jgi:hypothetical protein
VSHMHPMKSAEDLVLAGICRFEVIGIRNTIMLHICIVFDAVITASAKANTNQSHQKGCNMVNSAP